MPTDSCDRLTADDLAAMPLFADDDRAALEWLADHFEVRAYEPGEIIVREGSPAKDFIVILEGELHFRRPSDPYAPVFVRAAGQPTGVLPFSRIKVINGRGTAVGRTRIDDSAMNVIAGEVGSVVEVGNRVRVRIGPLTAEVTTSSAERLELARGGVAFATFKATGTRLVALA